MSFHHTTRANAQLNQQIKKAFINWSETNMIHHLLVSQQDVKLDAVSTCDNVTFKIIYLCNILAVYLQAESHLLVQIILHNSWSDMVRCVVYEICILLVQKIPVLTSHLIHNNNTEDSQLLPDICFHHLDVFVQNMKSSHISKFKIGCTRTSEKYAMLISQIRMT